MSKSVFKALAVAAGLSVLAVPAMAATVANITGGETRIRVLLGKDNGYTTPSYGVGGGASATVTGSGTLRVFIPITGGSVHPDSSVIEHAGSSVDVTVEGSTVTLSDFVINTGTGIVSATVGDQSVDAFSLSARNNGAFDLLITEDAGDVLESFFAANNDDDDSNDVELGGARFGVARVNADVAPIPLPAAGGMLLAGLGAFAALRARRRA